MLGDFESAPVGDALKATLRFLKKLSLEPTELGAEDARAVLATGVFKQALADAVHVAYLFSTYTRLADTLGWDVPADPAYFAGVAHRLLEKGYR